MGMQKTMNRPRRKSVIVNEGRVTDTRNAYGRGRLSRLAAVAAVAGSLTVAGALMPAPLMTAHAGESYAGGVTSADVASQAATGRSAPFVFSGRAVSPASTVSAVAHYASSGRIAPTKASLADHKILFGLVVLLFAGMMGVVALMWRRLVSTLTDASRSPWER